MWCKNHDKYDHCRSKYVPPDRDVIDERQEMAAVNIDECGYSHNNQEEGELLFDVIAAHEFRFKPWEVISKKGVDEEGNAITDRSGYGDETYEVEPAGVEAGLSATEL